MRGRLAAWLAPGAGAAFLLLAVIAGWSVPVALIGGACAMLAGAVAGLLLRLQDKEEQTSERHREQ
ncbi:MAG: hypothetical protein H6841_03955 [Planctomycetes bacterium]|nr:hypothetical protein [Planctomycetota bacterium]MCB9934530.1 hypothetical protein [Planctomycetota bacterium]